MALLNTPFALPQLIVDDAVRAALLEDLGRAGDITTVSTVPDHAAAKGELVSREAGIVCGVHAARTAFRLMEPALDFQISIQDGTEVAKGDVIATIQGSARAVLSAERVALNYMMHLSGIATHTAAFVSEVRHTRARISCTRKTIPGDRVFAKYAVRCGGGTNHRFGLDDAVLIKDNHIAVSGSVAGAVKAARAYVGPLVKVEIEVDTLEQLEEALASGPDAVLLANMGAEILAEAVAINKRNNDGRVKLEASGGVDLSTVRSIAETGVDFISTSKITMGAPSFDIGLDMGIS